MPQVEKFTLRADDRRFRHRLEIGLVNNMPDSALRATEMQFARLLKACAANIDVRLQLFSLPGIARGPDTLARMEGFYASTDMLAQTPLDALIVTGSEPRALDLRDEPYWPQFARLVDWAQRSTFSTLWSCLAAHGAVLHLDDIARRPLTEKCSGVFPCERQGDDPLFHHLRGVHHTPHSRRNTLDESELASHGYRILSCLADGDVDIFARGAGASHFLFFQGHPEYDAASLGREYLRDAGRFLRGECAEHPSLPQAYFDKASAERLRDLARAAVQDPQSVSLARYSEAVMLSMPEHSWRSSTTQLFGNWLRGVAEMKARRDAKPALRKRA